jgi:hypothetical protein
MCCCLAGGPGACSVRPPASHLHRAPPALGCCLLLLPAACTLRLAAIPAPCALLPAASRLRPPASRQPPACHTPALTMAADSGLLNCCSSSGSGSAMWRWSLMRLFTCDRISSTFCLVRACADLSWPITAGSSLDSTCSRGGGRRRGCSRVPVARMSRGVAAPRSPPAWRPHLLEVGLLRHRQARQHAIQARHLLLLGRHRAAGGALSAGSGGDATGGGAPWAGRAAMRAVIWRRAGMGALSGERRAVGCLRRSCVLVVLAAATLRGEVINCDAAVDRDNAPRLLCEGAKPYRSCPLVTPRASRTGMRCFQRCASRPDCNQPPVRSRAPPAACIPDGRARQADPSTVRPSSAHPQHPTAAVRRQRLAALHGLGPLTAVRPSTGCQLAQPPQLGQHQHAPAAVVRGAAVA